MKIGKILTVTSSEELRSANAEEFKPVELPQVEAPVHLHEIAAEAVEVSELVQRHD